MSELNIIVHKILEKGKGILAADESTGTMTKRLASVNVESTAENRLKFRSTLFSAEGMSNYISGVILYDETIKQKTFSGKTILVTGADGFVASHLREHLVSKNAKVVALLRRNSGGIFKNLNQIKKSVQIKWGDTQDL